MQPPNFRQLKQGSQVLGIEERKHESEPLITYRIIHPYRPLPSMARETHEQIVLEQTRPT